MNQLPEERTVWKTEGEMLVVTTHRIRFQQQHFGAARVISIMLEELRSCEIRYESYPWLILIGIGFFFLSGFIAFLSEEVIISLCIGGSIVIGSIFFYFVTRRQVLRISTGSAASIRLNTLGWGLDKTKELIDIIETEKNRRYLNRSPGL